MGAAIAAAAASSPAGAGAERGGGSSCCCDLAFAAGEGDESGLKKIGGLLHFCDLCWLFQLEEV